MTKIFNPIHISLVFIILLIWPLSLSEAGSIEPDKKSRLIVLPLQPEKTIEFDGTGLGVHFLLGNVVAVHTGLKEFWFGWRMTKIFRGKNQLSAYCRGNEPLPDIARLGEEQQIRYRLEGTYKRKQGMIFLALNLFDTLNPDLTNWVESPADLTDSYVGAFTVTVDVTDISWNASNPPESRYRIGAGTTYSFSATETWSTYSGEIVYYEVNATDILGNSNVTQMSESINNFR